jgi:hypothetical protein
VRGSDAGYVSITYNGDKATLTIPVQVSGIYSDGRFLPYRDDAFTLGGAGFKWKEIYANTSTINTSDRNVKNSIEPLKNNYTQFFNALQPVSYKFNEGTSGRTHIGFIA